jgi:uncharacterized iron-regulated membrane protein
MYSLQSITIDRQLWVKIHRYAGLMLAAFLVLSGISGALLVYQEQIQKILVPELHFTKSIGKRDTQIQPMKIREIVLSRYPDRQIYYTNIENKILNVTNIYIEPKYNFESGVIIEPGFDLYVDSFNGQELGRLNGTWEDGRGYIMPFILEIHESLVMGRLGALVLGVVALIWTIDCFIGFYLTLPVARYSKKNSPSLEARSWLLRWKPSWKIRRKVSTHKRTFDVHRAVSLWIWPLLFAFAWSAVAFNLPQIYHPTMSIFGGSELDATPASKIGSYNDGSVIAYRDAAALGAKYAKHEGEKAGSTLMEPYSINYDPVAGSYSYRFTSSLDLAGSDGGSEVVFDARTGLLQSVSFPSKQNAADTFTNWIKALHRAEVFGSAYRVVVAVLGVVIVILAITGLMLWSRKKLARLKRSTAE